MRSDRTLYDEKLDTILAAAAEIFAEKGYHNASIRDIARSTGVSLSGLYYYFESKEELLYLIQDHALTILLGELEERLAGVRDPHRRLDILIESHLAYFGNNMAEMKVMSHEASSLSGEFFQRVNGKKKQLTEVASEILRELQPDSRFDPRVATFALFGMMNWLYTWYKPGRDVSLERVVGEITQIFTNGYLSGSEAGASIPQPAAGMQVR